MKKKRCTALSTAPGPSLYGSKSLPGSSAAVNVAGFVPGERGATTSWRWSGECGPVGSGSACKRRAVVESKRLASKRDARGGTTWVARRADGPAETSARRKDMVGSGEGVLVQQRRPLEFNVLHDGDGSTRRRRRRETPAPGNAGNSLLANQISCIQMPACVP